MQLVVDSKCQILDVVAKWPGGTYDARVLTHSALAQLFKPGTYTGILLQWLSMQTLAPECGHVRQKAIQRSSRHHQSSD